MKVRLSKPIGFIKKMMRELLAFISLLFGMCSSQSCLILDAFCGASLYRFPNNTLHFALQFIRKWIAFKVSLMANLIH
jgi:hypothetical protein